MISTLRSLIDNLYWRHAFDREPVMLKTFCIVYSMVEIILLLSFVLSSLVFAVSIVVIAVIVENRNVNDVRSE